MLLPSAATLPIGTVESDAGSNHADIVRQIRQLALAIEPASVAHAFVASITSRKLEYRSALGSYAFARVLPEHPLVELPGCYATICRDCGWSQMPKGEEEPIEHLARERVKYGGVRHLSPGMSRSTSSSSARCLWPHRRVRIGRPSGSFSELRVYSLAPGKQRIWNARSRTSFHRTRTSEDSSCGSSPTPAFLRRTATLAFCTATSLRTHVCCLRNVSRTGVTRWSGGVRRMA